MSTESIAVIVTGVVGATGVVVPAVTTWLTKRGDRAHDLALRRFESDQSGPVRRGRRPRRRRDEVVDAQGLR